MATAYEVLGIARDAGRRELEAAYAAKRAEYDPGRYAELGAEFVQVAVERQAELAAAYRSLRPVVAAPSRLAPEVLRGRDRETMVALVLFALLALAVPLTRGVAAPQRTVAAEGLGAAALNAKPAPDFTLEAVGGNRVSLSDYRGKVVMLNLWATWCPPCVRETPRLVRTYEKYRDQGFVILGINTTYQDDRAKVEQFVRDKQVSYPVLFDMKDEFGQKYGSRLLPTSYLIDRSGKIVTTKVGEIDEAQLDEQVRALLREAGNSTP